MKTSWEPASTLPSSLIEDYEKGGSGDILESFSSGGQTIHTMSTFPSKTPEAAPKPKKRKFVEEGGNEPGSDTGYVQQQYMHYTLVTCVLYFCRFFADTGEDHSDIVCNTEKDKTRVNHRTAGVLS